MAIITADTTFYVNQMTWDDVQARILLCPLPKRKNNRIYGVPRGGAIIAGLLKLKNKPGIVEVVQNPREADLIVDDIIDSGRTRKRYALAFPDTPFWALIDKTQTQNDSGKPITWIRFPWEQPPEKDIESTIVRQLEYLGEDPNREGLIKTPERVVKSWKKLYGGYVQDPAEILSTTFTEPYYDQMVLMKDIELYSTCEHHMLPFFGKAHVAYLPSGKVAGASKLARLVEVYARRLQIQERICQQVVDALEEYLHPKGSACVIEAQHFCMTSRGVEKQKSIMITSALRGSFLNDQSTREEFMRLIS